MKTKRVMLITLVLIAFSLLSIHKVNAVINEIQHNKTITIKLNSIQCNMCAEKITEAIQSLSGVVKAKVNLSKKTATVIYNADKTNKEAIETAITSAGYDANDKKAKGEAYNNLMECCKSK